MSQGFRLPTEIPLEEYPKPDVFIEEAKNIVEHAGGVPLRVMGGLAIYLRISEKGDYYKNLWVKLGRLGERVFTDIDLASYKKFSEKVTKILTGMGYKLWQPSLWKFEGARLIFYNGRVPMVEIFFDKLKMNHEIPFTGRLELEKYTLPLADLLMTKLQIVKINEKDLKDSAILLRTYDVGTTDNDTINGEYIAKTLADDWGFYYTFTTNLNKLSTYIENLEPLNQDDVKVIKERIDKLLQMIESEPKSMKWKLRAKIGTKKMWYEEVEDWNY